jgi:hypothetical protein
MAHENPSESRKTSAALGIAALGVVAIVAYLIYDRSRSSCDDLFQQTAMKLGGSLEVIEVKGSLYLGREEIQALADGVQRDALYLKACCIYEKTNKSTFEEARQCMALPLAFESHLKEIESQLSRADGSQHDDGNANVKERVQEAAAKARVIVGAFRQVSMTPSNAEQRQHAGEAVPLPVDARGNDNDPGREMHAEPLRPHLQLNLLPKKEAMLSKPEDGLIFRVADDADVTIAYTGDFQWASNGGKCHLGESTSETGPIRLLANAAVGTAPLHIQDHTTFTATASVSVTLKGVEGREIVVKVPRTDAICDADRSSGNFFPVPGGTATLTCAGDPCLLPDVKTRSRSVPSTLTTVASPLQHSERVPAKSVDHKNRSTPDIVASTQPAFAEPLKCLNYRVLCSSKCVDLKRSVSNCGACNRTCLGSQVCLEGQCVASFWCPSDTKDGCGGLNTNCKMTWSQCTQGNPGLMCVQVSVNSDLYCSNPYMCYAFSDYVCDRSNVTRVPSRDWMTSWWREEE